MSNLDEYRALLKRLSKTNTFDSYQEIINNRIIDYVSKNPGVDGLELSREITSIFGERYNIYVEKAFANIETLNTTVNAIYTEMGTSLPRSLDKLQSLEGLNRIRYGNYKQKTISALNKTINRGLYDGLSVADLKKEVAKVGKKISFYADTITDTQYSAYGQTMKNFKSDLAGVEEFEYVGPVHQNTRPFCLKHLGITYTKSDIIALDGDPDLGSAGIKPVMVYKGGWNCYHDWEPVA